MRSSMFADIRITHEYYKGCCSGFSIKPMAESIKEIAQRNLLLRETAGGLKILSPEKTCSDLKSLYFGVYLDDACLWNVTLLEKSDKDQVPVIIVKDGVISYDFQSERNDMNDFGPMKPLFILHLELENTKSNYGIVEIPLKTRSCRWCYIIQGNIDIDNVAVYDVKSNKTSDFEIKTKSQRQIEFISRNSYPIVYGDVPRFQLRQKNSSRILVKALPNMDLKSLARRELNNGDYEIVAESFVNL